MAHLPDLFFLKLTIFLPAEVARKAVIGWRVPVAAL